MAQTAAHLADHVIPPVPGRQWVISVPKRLRGFLAHWPAAVAALTRVFIEEIERLLGAAAGVTSDASAPAAARPRLGAVSFLHRFGSVLNHHVHLHACATDGVFIPIGDGPPAFLPARPITQADLAVLTERVRRRVIRWFRLAHLLDASAAADMLRWENSGFSVDTSVRISLIDRDVRAIFRLLNTSFDTAPARPSRWSGSLLLVMRAAASPVSATCCPPRRYYRRLLRLMRQTAIA